MKQRGGVVGTRFEMLVRLLLAESRLQGWKFRINPSQFFECNRFTIKDKHEALKQLMLVFNPRN